MHRRKGSGEVSIQDQIDKRIFWTCYCLDRELSVALGWWTTSFSDQIFSNIFLARPPAIADNDIDVEVCSAPVPRNFHENI
jgi:Fungal specific transcription factor domain